MGMERLIMILKDSLGKLTWPCDIFIATLGETARRFGITLASKIRNAHKVCEISHEEKSLKAQMKLANRLGARFTAIIGEDELQKRLIVIRNMQTKNQVSLPLDDTLIEKIVALIG